MLALLPFKIKLILAILFIISWGILLFISVSKSRREDEFEISHSIFGSVYGKISWACLAIAGVVLVVL